MSIPISQFPSSIPDRQAVLPRFIRLRTTLVLSFVVVTILAAVVLVLVLFIQVRNNIRRTTQQHMIDVVSVAALQVNADTNASLTEANQENSDEYKQIKGILQRIRNSSANIRYVYTVRYINNQEIFIVDAETDPELVSHLGDVYEDALPSALSRMATANHPYIEPEINTDEWGTWLTSCAPLFRANGARGDFLCMDMSANELVNQERQFLWLALAIFAAMLPFAAGLGWWMGDRLAAPIVELITGVDNLAEGNLQYRVNVSARDETYLLGQAFNRMADRISEMLTTLKQQVDGQAGEVERRSSYLTAAAELGQAASSNLETDKLIQQVIDIIQKQFSLYYVGLFLLSEDGKWAELRAGTGKAGEAMISRDHRIAVGEGMIGWCITNAQARVAQEADQDRIRLEFPELPNTRSEAALPLRTRGHIIGALTVQSEQEKAFDETALDALQTLANQVAVAVDHTRLIAESREALYTAQRAYGIKGQTDWVKIFQDRPHMGFYANMENTLPMDESSPGIELSHLETKNVMHLPIRVRGQVLGTIHARKLDNDGAWNPEETALLATLTDQLSLALENARLYQDTQRIAEREHIISDITAKVRASTNVNVILQTAVKELAEALRVSKATVQLHDNPGDDGNNIRDNSSQHGDLNNRPNGGDSNG
jgi:GAF domain-containing protein/HAMP domain-containing protein